MMRSLGPWINLVGTPPKSLYRFITHGGVISRVDLCIWKCKLPQKIKVFLWQMYHGKLQAVAVLIKRGWKGDHRCCLCRKPESIDHIFFSCPLAQFTWCCIREVFGWEGFPFSSADFMENWLQNKFGANKSLALFIFAGFMWALWKNRNKMAIEKKFPKAPSKAVLNDISFMQK